MLSADFNGDFEENIEAEILERIRALPAGGNDKRLMQLLRFASGRRPWLKPKIEYFDRFNNPEFRFESFIDEDGREQVCDHLYSLFSGNISLAEATRTKHYFSGANGRSVQPKYTGT